MYIDNGSATQTVHAYFIFPRLLLDALVASCKSAAGALEASRIMCLRYHAHANDQNIMIDPFAEKHNAWYSGNADLAWLHVALRVQKDLQSAAFSFQCTCI